MGVAEDFGLVPALKELFEHIKQSGKLKIEFTPSMGDCQINPEHEIYIYRIVQELVSNVLKHAKATKLSLMLTCFKDENLVNILVQDNGSGCDQKTVKSKSDGMGLNSLSKIVQCMQGEILFDSNGINGTTVNIDLPIKTVNNLLEL
jgi:signal transduction histidine kinase